MSLKINKLRSQLHLRTDNELRWMAGFENDFTYCNDSLNLLRNHDSVGDSISTVVLMSIQFVIMLLITFNARCLLLKAIYCNITAFHVTKETVALYHCELTDNCAFKQFSSVHCIYQILDIHIYFISNRLTELFQCVKALRKLHWWLTQKTPLISLTARKRNNTFEGLVVVLPGVKLLNSRYSSHLYYPHMHINSKIHIHRQLRSCRTQIHGATT